MHPQVQAVTERIIARSRPRRQRYLQQLQDAVQQGPLRGQLGCTNLAHTYAAAPVAEKLILQQNHRAANIAIISAYNDILSAHAPYQSYPQQLKAALAKAGQVGQMAGGVPAMCDGVTQGQAGMELSLFSRDVIALSTAVALSHQVFDGSLLLGICDKIVPGLLMAALRFGHLPAVFVPSGPMPSGISNSDKAKVRQAYAAGQVGQDELLASEMASYHSEGTCTFYGTANSNQMLLEIMGLQLPGSSFINPNHPLRPLLTEAAAACISDITALSPGFMPIGQLVDERTLVNAMVGLLATGGSTNHSIHLPAIARMAGIELDWQDLAELSDVVPLLARVYPNGQADVNQLQRAGGMPFIIRELLDAGLLHEEVNTILGRGLRRFTHQPVLAEGALQWQPVAADSQDLTVLAPAHAPFLREGGMKLLQGNLGRAIMKVSAVPDERWIVQAPAQVFSSQQAVLEAYRTGALNRDVVVVLRGQGPAANGMPELHQLTPALTNLQDAGYQVALVTDGRMSGASGKFSAAIHLCPEAQQGGMLAAVVDGDLIRLDAHSGTLTVLTDGFMERPLPAFQSVRQQGVGRELFAGFRARCGRADEGAISIGWDDDDIEQESAS